MYRKTREHVKHKKLLPSDVASQGVRNAREILSQHFEHVRATAQPAAFLLLCNVRDYLHGLWPPSFVDLVRSHCENTHVWQRALVRLDIERGMRDGKR